MAPHSPHTALACLRRLSSVFLILVKVPQSHAGLFPAEHPSAEKIELADLGLKMSNYSAVALKQAMHRLYGLLRLKYSHPLWYSGRESAQPASTHM